MLSFEDAAAWDLQEQSVRVFTPWGEPAVFSQCFGVQGFIKTSFTALWCSFIPMFWGREEAVSGGGTVIWFWLCTFSHLVWKSVKPVGSSGWGKKWESKTRKPGLPSALPRCDSVKYHSSRYGLHKYLLKADCREQKSVSAGHFGFWLNFIAIWIF